MRRRGRYVRRWREPISQMGAVIRTVRAAPATPRDVASSLRITPNHASQVLRNLHRAGRLVRKLMYCPRVGRRPYLYSVRS